MNQRSPTKVFTDLLAWQKAHYDVNYLLNPYASSISKSAKFNSSIYL